MNCNEKLALYVKANGIKQNFLSEKTGIEQEKISNILNHKRKITADELVKFCEVLGLSLDFFKE